MLREEIVINTVPVGPPGIIAMKGCEKIAENVNYYLSTWRKARESEHKDTIAFYGYEKDNYIINADTPRFGSGEGKGVIYESVRGMDIYIIVDVLNNSIEYSIAGMKNHMSPDDHFADLKRIIAAIAGKAKRINVIMPFMYESRQHKRTARESLDCAMALQELYAIGVDNIITFDAHDPRVANAVPINGFESVRASYQFLKYLCKNEHDILFDKEHLLMISPDEGAIDRAVYFSSVLGIDMGMFYKRRDYSQIVNGMNPIVAHEYLGRNPGGKDVIIVDDMISSGGSMIDTAKAIKDRGAKDVYIFSTFGLFTNGLEKFDKAYEEGLFKRVLTTNATYQNPELFKREYYISVDLSKYISYFIEALNHNISISELLEPSGKIKDLMKRYKNRQFDTI